MPKVKWMQWGREAFERAKQEDKPILLDIGAAWCHWCHVMESTTYSDNEVVGLIHEYYVPVQVDTDARPDINNRYNRGGWPTTAFLTPEGDLMGGATYVPPAQMKRTLLDYATFYRENKTRIKDKVEEAKAKVRSEEPDREEVEESGIDETVVKQAVEDIKQHADFLYGGFGRAPKFPHPEPLSLALLWHYHHKDRDLYEIVQKTLDSMGEGGLIDHIGGGFHRYAVDAEWRVPHFEKLLEVNAGLLSSYIAGYRYYGKDVYREVAEDTITFMENVLQAPDGGFYSSQDADVYEGDDGSYFTWTIEEVKDALPPNQAQAAILFYGMTEKGNFENTPGRNIPYQALEYGELAMKLGTTTEDARIMVAKARKGLAEARASRTAPKVDKKIITSANCLAAKACFEAYEAFGDMNYKHKALQVVDFLIRNIIAPEGGAFHMIVDGEHQVHGLLADQAALTNACLDAYEATGRRTYLEHAEELAAFAIDRLSADAGGFYDSIPDAEDYIAEVKPRTIYENAEMARSLARLYVFTGEISYQDTARVTLGSLREEFDKMGYLAAGYALATDMLVNYPVELVTIGLPEEPDTQLLHETSLMMFEPRRMVQLLDPRRDGDLIERKGYTPANKATLFMCVNNTCAPPIHTPEQLRETYERFISGAVLV